MKTIYRNLQKFKKTELFSIIISVTHLGFYRMYRFVMLFSKGQTRPTGNFAEIRVCSIVRRLSSDERWYVVCKSLRIMRVVSNLAALNVNRKHIFTRNFFVTKSDNFQDQ